MKSPHAKMQKSPLLNIALTLFWTHCSCRSRIEIVVNYSVAREFEEKVAKFERTSKEKAVMETQSTCNRALSKGKNIYIKPQRVFSQIFKVAKKVVSIEK